MPQPRDTSFPSSFRPTPEEIATDTSTLDALAESLAKQLIPGELAYLSESLADHAQRRQRVTSHLENNWKRMGE